MALKSMNLWNELMNQARRKDGNRVLRETTSIMGKVDYHEDFQADCPPDSKKYQFKIDKLRVFKFSQEYDQIKAQILSRIPFPTLVQSYAAV